MRSVTVGIPTKNRYSQLAQTVQSVVFQTVTPKEIIIVDDSDEPRKDLRDLPEFQSLFRLMEDKKIDWRVIYGQRMGQHISHQIIQDEAKGELVWRIDDDEIASPDVLAILSDGIEHLHAGAVGGLVLFPSAALLPPEAKQEITSPDENIQWFSHNGSNANVPVGHLHSTFLYRKGIARYELGLSPAAHREETLFTHEIKRAGHGLYVIPKAVTWHLRSESGGIRSTPNPQFWEDDEKLFRTKLNEWGVAGIKTRVVVLDSGKGDHIIFKSILPELRKVYDKIVIASCYDDVFAGEEDIELISIAEAQNRYGKLDRFNIYRWCIDHKWGGSMQNAYRGMYLQ